MGQGFSLATPPAGAAGIDVPELADLVYEKSIGVARFMKTIRARHHDGVVLVKVLVKPYPMTLEGYKQDMIGERRALAGIPNVLPYQRAIETETNGYLVRQYLYNSLYDRLSTRPFLEEIEKKWIAYQLLCALRDCHAKDIYHGDIKTENTLVTSWNWLYLSDFSSSFKPVLLPDNNPADFGYFFDTSGRRTCYLAPERFVAPDEAARPDSKITWAMDMFSAGCVIAELFLETPIFTLSQMINYRKGEYDAGSSYLSRIPDKDLREMIVHMIQLDPQKRYSAEQYLEFGKNKVFPGYFYDFLHQYMEVITDPSAGGYPTFGSLKNIGEADRRIERVWLDFDKISYFLGYRGEEHVSPEEGREERRRGPRLGLGHFPVRLDIPNRGHLISTERQPPGDDGTLIFLNLVVSSLRNTAHAAAKIKACDILLAFAERLTDEARLDRVLPYLMTLLDDKCDMVVVAVIRTMTQLLDLVSVITPVNAQIFLEYIMPRMDSALLRGQTLYERVTVRATYASSIGRLATRAERFLKLAATLGADGSVTVADSEVEAGDEADAAVDSLFDASRRELAAYFEMHTKILIEDKDPFVRRAFLSSVPDLCVFFGVAQASDIILSHLNTYLNDRDWMLKCAFFDSMVGISTFLGPSTLERFILPIMVQAVADSEEFVVQGALHSLAELARLGLLSRGTFLDLVRVVGRFTMHPNLWIRESAAEFLSAGTVFQSLAFLRVLVLPLVEPFLKAGMLPTFEELGLLDELRKPLSRSVFDQALLWATKAEKGDFWKPFQQVADLTIGSTSARGTMDQVVTGKSWKKEEDEQWLGRLRNLGLAAEDEPKLLALGEFIWRLGHVKEREARELREEGGRDDGSVPSRSKSMIRLRDLKMTPQTVMFEEEPPHQPTAGPSQEAQARTIKDALLDASISDDVTAKRRRAAFDEQRSCLNSRDRLSPTCIDSRLPLDDVLASARTTSEFERFGEASKRTSSQGRAAAMEEGIGQGGQGGQSGYSGLSGHSGQGAPHPARRSLRLQSSAMSLLDRKNSYKSIPETGTTETNAFGQLESAMAQPRSDGVESRESNGDKAPTTTIKPMHSYAGHDPNIRRMLDLMYVDNYPHDVAEFGPMVSRVTRRKSSRMTVQGMEEGWKPSGKLVATFSEHDGTINRIVVSPDHAFFLTGGDDGCVRVWDTMRLERNNTHRSRQTHRHTPGSKVVALCFIENTHCFVSCASDGGVHIVKVDLSTVGNTVRYGKLRLLREYRLVDGAYAVWCEHFKQEPNSVLILATNRSVVLGIDLRTMSLLFKLENPVQHGTPTCFCIDRKRNWLCLGTSHGVLDLWDLRFKMRLKGWGVPGKGPIYRLCVHPTKGRGKWVCVAGGTGQGEVTVWDLEKTLCREIYRVGGNKEGPKGYDAWEVDQDKPERMLGRFATDMGPSAAGNSDRGVRAMIAGTGTADDQRDVRHAYIITAGSDKKLRFWVLGRVEQSLVFSGLQPFEGRPTFTASHPTTSMTLNTERLPRPPSSSSSTPTTTPTTTHTGPSKSRAPRSSVISLEQGLLLRSHLDAITDVAILEVPYTMTVSVDRSGVVFVYQ